MLLFLPFSPPLGHSAGPGSLPIPALRAVLSHRQVLFPLADLGFLKQCSFSWGQVSIKQPDGFSEPNSSSRGFLAIPADAASRSSEAALSPSLLTSPAHELLLHHPQPLALLPLAPLTEDPCLRGLGRMGHEPPVWGCARLVGIATAR